MSTTSSPTTPKAKSAEVAAPSSPSFPIIDTFELMEHYRTHQISQHIGDRFANARNLTPTRAPTLPPPRSSFEGNARAAANMLPPAVDLPAFDHQYVPPAAYHNVHVSPDGSLVRSATGRPGEAPGSYRSPFDYNMVHRAPRGRVGGIEHIDELYNEAASHARFMFPLTPAPAPLYHSAFRATPAHLLPHLPTGQACIQTQAVIPPPGTPQRLILLGPLRMVRAQCVVKKEYFRPIRVWIDQFMGEELRTSAKADPILPNIVYAVNIPMDDEHWEDYKKVLAVFPRAAAWQEALKSEEPFDHVTGDHATAVLFREGEPLVALLADLVQQYDLSVSHDVTRPWDAPGQAEWMAPVAREVYACR